MHVQSLYIDQSCMINLCTLPLHSLDNLRPAFQTIFSNKKCFTEMGRFICDGKKYDNILYYDTEEYRAGLSRAPFISNMGHIGFHTKSAYLISRRDFRDYEENEIFGYFSDLEDQRMNFLYFELCPPIKLRVFDSEKKLVATGKIFAHIYPSGYLYLHLSFSYLNCTHIQSGEDLEHIIKKFSPLLSNTGFTFYSKFGALSLAELCKELYKNLFLSIYTQQENMTVTKPDWIASALVISDVKNESDIADLFQLNHYYNSTDIFKRKFKMRTDWRNEITTDYIYCKGKINFYFSNIKRGAILHTFWKFLHLVEFVNYKKKIYDIYKNFFKSETLYIQNLRLSSDRQFYYENMFGKEFFDSDIPSYLLLLDKMVTTLGSTERALYSYLSQNFGLDKSREQMFKHEADWISQLEKWKEKQPVIFKLLKLLPTILKS